MCIPYLLPSNHIIDALPDEVRRRWSPHLERVDFPRRVTLHEPGCRMNFAYFPTTAVVSIVCVTADGDSTEVAVLGNEGLVGIELLLGGGSMPNRAVVETPGGALQLPAWVLQDEIVRAGSASQLMLRYTLALSTQVSQSAVCNRHHSLYERLCTWLLMNLDRGQSNLIVATHERISHALGVRREGVTEAALKLQSLGLISYARGLIQVHERKGLQRQACECYGIVKNEFDRLLHESPSRIYPVANTWNLPTGQSRRVHGGGRAAVV